MSDLQRKKIITNDHLSMWNCSGAAELDKTVKLRISRSAWCTFSRVEQIRGFVPRENEHHGAHFRGWCTNRGLFQRLSGNEVRGIAGEKRLRYVFLPNSGLICHLFFDFGKPTIDHCCVPRFSKGRRMSPSLSYHSFPLSSELRKHW